MNRIDLSVWCLCLFLLVALALMAPTRAWPEQEAEWKKLQRLQATEFCAIVKRPPKVLIDAVQQSFEKDPAAWGPSMQWISKLGKAWAERGCSDA